MGKWTNCVIGPVSMFHFWVMDFFQIYVDLSKKSFKSIKAIYMHSSERSFYTLLKNGIVYYAMTYCFGGFEVEKIY